MNLRLHNSYWSDYRPSYLVIQLAFIVGFMVVFSNSTPTYGQIFYSASSEGAGDTGRASYDAFGSQFLNPATLVLGTGYTVGAAYQSVNPQLDSPSSTTAMMITENDPDKYASAGAGYVYRRQSYSDHTVINQDVSLSIGFKLLPKLAVGIIGHQLYSQNSMSSGFREYNISPGLLYLVAPFWTLALVGYDIIDDPAGNMIPVSALATEINVMGIFKTKIDVVRPEKMNPNHNANLNAGLDFDLGDGFLFRTGGIWDTVNTQTYWTAGLGWYGPKLCAAYAYKTNVNVASALAHTFQMWVNF